MSNSNVVRLADYRPAPLQSYPHEVLPFDVAATDDAGGVEESPRTAELRRAIDVDLAALGVCYRRRILRLFELAEIAQALVEVEDARRDGRVYNPAGLFVRVLEGNTGRGVFR